MRVVAIGAFNRSARVPQGIGVTDGMAIGEGEIRLDILDRRPARIVAGEAEHFLLIDQQTGIISGNICGIRPTMRLVAIQAGTAHGCIGDLRELAAILATGPQHATGKTKMGGRCCGEVGQRMTIGAELSVACQTQQEPIVGGSVVHLVASGAPHAPGALVQWQRRRRMEV